MDADQKSAPLDAHGIQLVTELANGSAAPAIIDIKTKGLGPGLPDTVPVGFDRKAQDYVSLKARIEEFRTAPARRRGTATADTLESFIKLVDRHKGDQSVLFGRCIWPEPKLTAVIDYDDAQSAAAFHNHRVVYAFPLTEEFKAWVDFNAKPMAQDVFAAFLEEHSAELAAPHDGEKAEYERLFNEKMATPSEVVALSRHLEVHVAAKAKQGIRLQSGERQVEFSEEHFNSKGESVVIPGIFMLSVPAFIDGDLVRIPARLRYRIAGGDIKWFYQLYRWEFFLREQVERDLDAAAKATDLPAFEGAPEA